MSKWYEFSYPDLERDMLDLLHKIADVRIKNVQSVDYNGIDIEEPIILCIDTTVKEAFTKEDLKRRRENGQNKLQVFINKLYQIGYAQGYKRAEAEYNRFSKYSEEDILNHLAEIKDKLIHKKIEQLKIWEQTLIDKQNQISNEN